MFVSHFKEYVRVKCTFDLNFVLNVQEVTDMLNRDAAKMEFETNKNRNEWKMKRMKKKRVVKEIN